MLCSLSFLRTRWLRSLFLLPLQVTVYRLICKDTIEEKILQRARQKNAVQELVMKGKHVQDDHLMRQEDVVSLLIDDTQIAHKLKEISMQVILSTRQ
jgi:chromatin-remodeling ATPase INO80